MKLRPFEIISSLGLSGPPENELNMIEETNSCTDSQQKGIPI